MSSTQRAQPKPLGEFMSLALSGEYRTIVASSEENKRLLKNCVSAILVLGQNKKIIRKVELNKLIYTGSRAQHHTVRKAVLAHANHDLNKYLGLRLYDLGDDRGYILVNTTNIPTECRKEFDPEDCNELAVIYLTLMEIFSSADESATDEQIIKVLSALELTGEEIKKYIDMLLKKLYITLERDNYQKDEKIYRWGPRAIAEVDPERFMKSFLDFAEGGSADDWPDQKRRVELLKKVANR